MVDIEGVDGDHQWLLANVRPLVPKPLKGRIFTYAVDAKLVKPSSRTGRRP